MYSVMKLCHFLSLQARSRVCKSLFLVKKHRKSYTFAKIRLTACACALLDFKVVYRPGHQHRNANALSRAPCKKCLKQQKNDSCADDDSACSPVEPPMSSLEASSVWVVTRIQNGLLTAFKQTLFTVNHWSLDDIMAQQQLDPSLLSSCSRLKMHLFAGNLATHFKSE